MPRYHGSKGQIKADPTGGATTVVIASLNAFTIDMTRDKVDVTAFGDTNKQYVQGLKDIKGTIGGWFDTTDDKLFDIADGDVAAMLELVPSTLAPTYLWKGLALLDASINVTATGAVSISSTWVGAGPWTRMPAAVVRSEGERREGEYREGEYHEGTTGGVTGGPLPRRR